MFHSILLPDSLAYSYKLILKEGIRVVHGSHYSCWNLEPDYDSDISMECTVIKWNIQVTVLSPVEEDRHGEKTKDLLPLVLLAKYADTCLATLPISNLTHLYLL